MKTSQTSGGVAIATPTGGWKFVAVHVGPVVAQKCESPINTVLQKAHH